MNCSLRALTAPALFLSDDLIPMRSSDGAESRWPQQYDDDGSAVPLFTQPLETRRRNTCRRPRPPPSTSKGMTESIPSPTPPAPALHYSSLTWAKGCSAACPRPPSRLRATNRFTAASHPDTYVEVARTRWETESLKSSPQNAAAVALSLSGQR